MPDAKKPSTMTLTREYFAPKGGGTTLSQFSTEYKQLSEQDKADFQKALEGPMPSLTY